MRVFPLALHPALARTSRVPRLVGDCQQLQLAEVMFLAAVGCAAAVATVFVDFHPRMPGHAVLRAVLPIALGLAVVPRRMGGTVMSGSALATALAVKFTALGAVGAGALASLVLIGPLLDAATWRARAGRGLYFGFIVAALGANLAAFVVRSGAKLAGLEHVGARPFSLWWPQAVVSYALFGILAGLLSAAVWFQLRDNQHDAANG